MPSNYQIVLCTCPDDEVGLKIAHALVEQKLAACVNIIPAIASVYAWEDKIETERESLLIIKTQSQCYESLEETISNLHPYEIPEIVAIPMTEGSKQYLDWITKNTQ